MHILRTHPLQAAAAGLGLIAVLAWLAFGYFGVHLLFIDDEVREAVPVFDLAPVAAPTDSATIGFSGRFVDGAHSTSGRAVVLGNGSDQRFVRFEDFATDNGPDLNVYLVNSSVGGVTDFIDLGDLKGNIGEQNFEVPTDADLAVYDEVVIWCVRFGVGFGSASLLPT